MENKVNNLDGFDASRRRVAIVGSGPGGLVAAKYLRDHGFEPIIFEQADDIGGQWNVRSPSSGVWPSMVTNTSRLLTCFSDLCHRPETPLFPSNEEMLSYLHRYTERFGLVSHLRIRTRVELIEHSVNDAMYKVTFRTYGSKPKTEIVFGTGFELSLPFLSPEISGSLNLEAMHIELHKFTFHPDWPGLAFIGLFDQTGPYFPPLELQARWITYVWSGILPTPSRDEMWAGIATHRCKRGGAQKPSMHIMSLMFAREAGVEPNLSQYPALVRALLFGPLTSASFRLSGPDSLPEIAAQITEEARTLRTVVSPEFSSEELTQLETLVAARKDPEFTDFVHRMRRSE